MASEKTYIQVIVPLKLEWEPFYSLDADERVNPGDFVSVPFAGRQYIAVVSECTDALPQGMNPKIIKEIYSVHTEIPSLSSEQLEFFRKISGYYMCSLGEVLKMACPASRSTYCSSSRRNKSLVATQTMTPGASSGKTPLGKMPLPVLLNESMNVKQMTDRCAKVLEKGNVLWLVPDSSALKVLEAQLRPEFDDTLLVFSQEMTPAKRNALEMAMRSGSRYLLISTRGALFLPFNSLDLIIVQEEHSASYKQGGMAPRYNARDAAVMLAGIYGSSIVLQSRTPSLESIYNCIQKKFELAGRCGDVTECFNGVSGCLKDIHVEIVDTRAELRKNGMAGDVPKLLLPQFRDCDDNSEIAFVKLRKALFPKSEELRAQLDAIFGAGCFFSDDPVLNPLPDNTVSVCVFGMDALLTKNDFRADERALQELFAVIEPCLDSLRQLVILTRQASHSVFSNMFDFNSLLAERQTLSLPPFSRIVDIHVKADDHGKYDRMREYLAHYIPSLSCESYSVEDGWRVVLPKDKSLISKKQALEKAVGAAEKEFKCHGAVSFDVDP